MSFVEIIDTDYGKMMVHKYDTGQTQTLKNTRKALAWKEIDLLKRYLEGVPDAVFVDIGANVGCFSFALQSFCKKVVAFEAQRMFAYMIAGSIALNGWEHIKVHNIALGEKLDYLAIPKFDNHQMLSWGSVEFGDEQKEFIGQPRITGQEPDWVDVYALDHFSWVMGLGDRKITAIKIDVEGMECAVLRGGYNTIQAHKPIMLIEHLKSNRNELEFIIKEYGYSIVDVGMDLLCTPLDKT